MPKTQRQTAFVIDSKATFGPVSGPLVGGLAALVLTAAIWMSERIHHPLPAWLPLAVSAFCVAVTAAVSCFRLNRPADVVFRIGCWVAAGVWSFLTLTVARDQYAFMVIVLVVLAGGAGMLAHGMYGTADSPGPVAQPVDSTAPTPLGRRDAWEIGLQHYIGQLLSLRDGETVQVLRTNTWNNESGATFQVAFSAGSSKGLRDIAGITVPLQQCLRLQDGCTVTPRKSGKQGVVLLDVMFYNDLGTIHYYPTTFNPRSGRDDIPIGLHGDHSWSTINLYQKSMMLIGIRGGGKTVLLQNITAWLMQCVDVVVWIADLNGGSLAMPWMYGKATGKLAGYPIDWVAHTPLIALKMGEAAVRIAQARKIAYSRLLFTKNTEKLPISSKVPMLMIIVDEGAELMGETADKIAMEATEAFQQAQRIGRAMCVNVIFCGQRATSDYIPAQAKKLAEIKVAVRVDDEAELAHLFGWKKAIYDVEDMVHDGTMLVRTKTGAEIRLVKGLYIEPQTMGACAEATMTWRPKLDEVSAQAGGADYYERWDDPATVAWMEVMSSASLDDLGTLVDETTGALREPSQAATTTAVLDRPEPTRPQPAGGSIGPERTGTNLSSLRRLMAENDAILEHLGVPLDNDEELPDLPGPGAAGTGGDPGAHDRDAQLRRRVLDMPGEDVLSRLNEMFNMDADEAGGNDTTTTTTPPVANNAAVEPVEATSPANGKKWVLEYLRSRDGEVRVREIVDAAAAAGLTTRRGSISEWLAALSNEGLVEGLKYGSYRARPEA